MNSNQCITLNKFPFWSHFARLILHVCFQVDIFVIDSVFLGKLSSIRIGHSETKLGEFSITIFFHCFDYACFYQLYVIILVAFSSYFNIALLLFLFLGYGWFLDKVFIKEGTEATRAFEFSCNR